MPRWGGTRVDAERAFVVSHGSALAFWRGLRAGDDLALREALDDLYPTDMLLGLDDERLDADSTLRPLELPGSARRQVEELMGAVGSEGPVDVIVGSRSRRRLSPLLSCHAWKGPIPDGLLYRLRRGIYVCAPELVFLQMAGSLSLVGLMALGYEMCGTYTVPPAGTGTCVDEVRRLTSVERLAHVARLARGIDGLVNAEAACGLMHDGARSPMEAHMALILGLPRSRGGFGCGPMLLNERIDLSDDARRVAGRGYLVMDLFLPRAGTCLEYQGAHHQGSANRASDDARASALAIMGIQSMRIWGEQLYDECAMAAIAGELCRRAGVRRHPESVRMLLRRGALFSELSEMSRE